MLVLASGAVVGDTAAHDLLARLTGERSPAPQAENVLSDASDDRARALASRHALRTPGVGDTPDPSPSPTSSRTRSPEPAATAERESTRTPAPAPDPRDAATSARTRAENAVVRLTNAARTRQGCAPVRRDPALHRAARRHSADMASSAYFDHVSPDGLSFVDRARRAGYASPASENIAFGQPGPEAVVAAWLASPGHRANILDCEVTEVGVGLARADEDGGTPYWTQMFGRG
ncbi:MAG: CAP domain-containing protein [Actinomycetes bacterium]